ncbi:hypothetical protein JCM11251_000881 [Rhodosporidiobolus azoricus]
MLGLLQRTKANLQNTSTPISWSPSDPVPSGFSSTQQSFSLPISSLSAFTFRAAGHYARGTLVIERAGGQAPPEYVREAEAGERDRKERETGIVEITSEVRANSEGLLKDCKLEASEAHERCGLTLNTPASTSVSRIGASLSYHITVTMPDSLSALDSLVVEASGFRLNLAASLSSTLLSNLNLTTTDAPISLGPGIRAQAVSIRNRNEIDSNKVQLSNFDPLVSGSILSAERIELDCADGPIEGSYSATGAVIAHTTNSHMRADFTGSSIRVSTGNGELVGKFKAKKDVILSNNYGKIDVEVEAPKGCQITGQNSQISGKFKVGKQLRLSTTHFRIDASVHLLPPPSSSLPVHRPSSPAPSTRTTSTSLSDGALPTFEEATGASPSSSTGEVVQVTAETSGAAIQLDYVEQPEGVVVHSFARSNGGGRVEVVHPKTFEGTFSASTSLTHTAHLTLPSSFASATQKRLVRYTTEKRSEVAGTVEWEGSGGTGRSRSVIEAEGAAEIKIL